jgi:hypothetical protein
MVVVLLVTKGNKLFFFLFPYFLSFCVSFSFLSSSLLCFPFSFVSLFLSVLSTLSSLYLPRPLFLSLYFFLLLLLHRPFSFLSPLSVLPFRAIFIGEGGPILAYREGGHPVLGKMANGGVTCSTRLHGFSS